MVDDLIQIVKKSVRLNHQEENLGTASNIETGPLKIQFARFYRDHAGIPEPILRKNKSFSLQTALSDFFFCLSPFGINK